MLVIRLQSILLSFTSFRILGITCKSGQWRELFNVKCAEGRVSTAHTPEAYITLNFNPSESLGLYNLTIIVENETIEHC